MTSAGARTLRRSGVWTAGLRAWYAVHGRHDLPWRHTRDPWAVLVSEVMLQQTSVTRVLPRWQPFLARWPAPAACAAASLGDVLRAWQGLGYPRRALALHRCAGTVARDGWPEDEAGLRRLPGVGRYTARALGVLAFDRPGPLPCDVNIHRVVARAALGVEPERAPATAVDAALAVAKPGGMSRRDLTLALFDVGALHCRAAPRCAGCPLLSSCRLPRAAPPRPRARPRPAYAGSFRQLRGHVLREALAAGGTLDAATLAPALPAHDVSGIARALASLQSDGLLPAPAHHLPSTLPR